MSCGGLAERKGETSELTHKNSDRASSEEVMCHHAKFWNNYIWSDTNVLFISACSVHNWNTKQVA